MNGPQRAPGCKQKGGREKVLPRGLSNTAIAGPVKANTATDLTPSGGRHPELLLTLDLQLAKELQDAQFTGCLEEMGNVKLRHGIQLG